MLNKKKFILYIFLFVFSLAAVIFTYNDHFIYNTPIVKITNIENKYSDEINNETIEQHITGIIKNGEYKDKEITFDNTTSFSGVYDEQLHNNSEVFVKLIDDGNTVSQIEGIKRDKYLAILLVLFLDLSIIIGGIKGVKSIISLIINVILSVVFIFLYLKNIVRIDLLPLFILLSFIFIFLSLVICHGFNKKTLVSVLSSIISMLISFGLAFIVLNCYKKEIYFWNMDYVEVINDYEGIFYINILLCGLGAIMDIAITMASSLSELISKNNKISIKELRKSGKMIAKDILGTMINVMLFTCYISVVPMIILYVRNRMPLASVLADYGQIEMIRVLTSCISIVLAIPISLYITLFIYKGVKKHD